MGPQLGLPGLGPLPMQGNGSLAQVQQLVDGAKAAPSVQSTAETFGQALEDVLHQVNSAQAEADGLATGLATGGQADIAAVVMAAEQARLALELAVEVRNKVLEFYQEIMRMQV